MNLKGRERDGIVEPGEQREALLTELKERLEAVTDFNGKRVIRGVYRSDQIYSGNATALAPDLIVGYARGYRASWATCLGDLTEEVLLDNDSAWSADHCADALEVPGVLVLQPPRSAASRRRWSTSPRRSWPSSGCPRRRRWSAKTSFQRESRRHLRLLRGDARGQGKDRTGASTIGRSVAAEAAGYSSVEEFIADCIEKAIQRLKIEEDEGQVSDQLRGLGYIE